MSLWSRFSSFAIALVLLLSATEVGFAKSLNADLSNLEFGNLDREKWQITNQQENILTIDCLNCPEQVLINVLVSPRENFGPLGDTQARKAQNDCYNEQDGVLQCETIEGFDMGPIASLISSIRVLDNFFVGSYILGDDKTLIQIRAKAPNNDSAISSVKQIYDALKKDIIVQ